MEVFKSMQAVFTNSWKKGKSPPAKLAKVPDTKKAVYLVRNTSYPKKDALMSFSRVHTTELPKGVFKKR
jgi:hypothetical protein